MSQPLHLQTIASLRSQLRSGDISATDILRSVDSAITERDPAIGAYLNRDLPAALAAAEKADLSLPLGGIPIAMKDLLNVAGQPAGCSSRMLTGYTSPYDATCVARLKAAGYNMPSAQVNGMHVLAVHDVARQALDQVRAQQSPFFLELHTYRFRAHSMYDAELYRDKAEVERWKQHDPIATFAERLKAAQMMSDDDLKAIDRAAQDEVEAAVAFAQAGTWEPVEQLLRDVTTPAAPAVPTGSAP